MFDVAFSSQARTFLKKAEKPIMKRLIERAEELRTDPFPRDVKSVVNRKEKYSEFASVIIGYNILSYTRKIWFSFLTLIKEPEHMIEYFFSQNS